MAILVMGAIVKLRKIAVNSLFGVFDHEIPVNLEAGITILIGENGLGKTVILEMVRAFFTKNFSWLEKVNFKSIVFTFDNNEVWHIERTVAGAKVMFFVERGFVGKADRTKAFRFYETAASEKERRRMVEMQRHFIIERELSLTSRLHRDFGLDDQALRHLKEKIYRDTIFGEDSNEINLRKAPGWFQEGLNSISVKIIETQRIITAKERGGDAYINTVKMFASDLVSRIAAATKESANISTELDASYPNRLMEKLRQGQDSLEDLNIALGKLDERRRLLSSIGLLDDSTTTDQFQMVKADALLMYPLKLYLDDSHQKLAPYDDISQKINLFKRIIDLRFKHKNIEFSREEGFSFRSRIRNSSSGQFEGIPASALSSGEQNELVMFYELIFKTKHGDMIFIDEPELSLHISWQNNFIEDLKEVTSMNKVAIVIATHSPDIISNNWTLKVELFGVE